MGMSAEQSGAAPGPPLGELLLSRGLITAEQLEEALADQRDSGRPLGEIFVRLGFATGPMIGQALATQQGRMLKSEYGFATGFDAISPGTDEDEREPPPVTIRSAERPKLVPDGVPLAQAGGLRLASPPQPAAVQAPAVAAAPNAAPDDGQAVNADPPSQELADAKAAVEASQRAQDAATAELRENVSRLEADVDHVTRERDEAGAQLQAAAAAHAALAGELEHVSNQLIAALAERDAALASSEAPDEEKTQMAGHVERLEHELADAKDALGASQQAATEAHAALAAELEQMATQLIAALAERDAALASPEAPDEDKAQMAAHVERLEQELADAKAALEASQRAATEALAALAERDATLASPEAPDEEKAQMAAHVERLEHELADAKDALGASQQAATEAHAALAAELEQMATQLIAALAERDAAVASPEAPDEEKAQMAAHVERLEQELADAKDALEAAQRATTEALAALA